MKKTFFPKNKLPLLISLLVSLCLAYFFVGKMDDKNDVQATDIKEKTELDTIQHIQEDTTGLYKLPFIIYQSKLDTVVIGESYEFLQGGSIYSTTLRDTTKLSNFLSSYFGKYDDWNYGKIWQNVKIEEKGKYWVESEIRKEMNPDHFSIRFTITDEKRNLLKDTVVLNFFKELIHKYVFTQPKIMEGNKGVEELRYRRYMPSVLVEFEPTNFSEIRNKMYKDSVFSACGSFDLECIIDRMGKIEIFEPEDTDSACIKKLDKYISQFQYPVFFLDSTKQERIKYKINLVIRDSIGRELENQKVIKNEIALLNENSEKFREFLKEQHEYYTHSKYLKNKKGENIGFLHFSGQTLFYFSKKTGKWKHKQNFEIEGEGIETKDLNNDGIDEISLFTGGNMNGNSWCDLFSYDKKGDSLVVAAKSIINPLSHYGEWSSYSCESNKEFFVKKNTAIRQQVGSWYTPVFNKIYNWEDNQLVLKAIFGTELVHYTMTDKDIPTFFAYQTINGSLQLTHQFASTDETTEKECRISNDIFKKYNK
ncbi:hypothetical protein Fleli_1293 [Bernardetia litoralis DSM 6794]|uniref:Uncharacterized protein n=1 Tax=Bernardetia litoralis (strain ATCC 23117 / DSM 6794 / NBRC 15988 / NCIMB 1366 / Fx l1 / Sio-4) TaxID=880071 RepID=I4AIE2_BERLS|nr:hypothetical protein [Bernardetia litoralis]AFM03727.1 hypothetical protein Fleli_1293 [Bernardetia litoralis DSM 6794]